MVRHGRHWLPLDQHRHPRGVNFHLEPLSAKSVGRPIAIIEGKPRVFKFLKQGVDAGSVSVELVDGQCVVTNRSQRIITINGEERTRAVLATGDTLAIGKDSFRVLGTDSEMGTQAMEPSRASGYHPTPAMLLCSACAAQFDDSTGVQSGAMRICATCVKKGVQPEHLALQPAARDVETATRDVKTAARDVESEVIEAPTTGKSTSESDRHRRRRSISASMHSVVEPPRKTILNRVSLVFSAKNRTDRSREEGLQAERHQLLEEAGRQVLAAHALGLPDHAISDLLAGRTVTIRPEEISRAPLERWRELTERVALLDAEIAAVRQTLGMGPDLGSVRLTAPHGRVDLKQREERVFATLDALTTQELGPDPDTGVPAPVAAMQAAPEPLVKSSVSGRSRVSGRRRHL